MKKLLALSTALLLSLAAIGCTATETAQILEETPASLAGRYVGYSWKDQAKGEKLEDAKEYIETILELDESGVITDAKMRFFVQKDGFWIMRQSGEAYVKVDYSAEPTFATLGENYKAGNSMFSIHTADMMSFYAAGVDSNGVVAAAIVDPVTRYQYEMKFNSDFDFSRPVSELTIGSGLVVPTVRTSSGALIKPSEWESLKDKTIFGISPWSHVLNDVGVLEGITEESSIQEMFEALGVTFDGGKAQAMDALYGYYGLGGWKGNHDAIAQSLIGKNATEVTSLVDWSNERYIGAINDKNQFGIDVESGATKTVQNSLDGISGATVRISREATSYQRALVNAGIISEKDVIIGRF